MLTIFLGIPSNNDIDKDTCAWISLNSPMSKKYGSKISIAAWIHSHVQGVECCFSSVDVHTQFTLSKTFNDILGLVFELDKDGDPKKHDFYGLTRRGFTKVNECRKPGLNFHDECTEKSYYTSQKHLIDPIDGPLEVHDFFALQHTGKQLDEKEWPTIENDLTKQSKQPTFHEKTTIQSSKSPVQNTNEERYFEYNKNVRHECNNPSQQYDIQDDVILDTEDTKEDDIEEDLEEQKCEGCDKFIKTESFLMHVGRAKKCKAVYGERYEEMQKARKKDAESKRKGKRTTYYQEYHIKNKKKRNETVREWRKSVDPETKKTYFKEYHAKNKEKRNETARVWRQSVKMSNSEYQQRVMKFKKETKDGPSYACQCCQRTLFYRGNV